MKKSVNFSTSAQLSALGIPAILTGEATLLVNKSAFWLTSKTLCLGINISKSEVMDKKYDRNDIIV
jgi:hypothetical protein